MGLLLDGVLLLLLLLVDVGVAVVVVVAALSPHCSFKISNSLLRWAVSSSFTISLSFKVAADVVVAAAVPLLVDDIVADAPVVVVVEADGGGGGHMPGKMGTYGPSTTRANGGYGRVSNGSNDMGSTAPEGMELLHG